MKKKPKHTFGFHALVGVAALVVVWLAVLSSSYFPSLGTSLSNFNFAPLETQASASPPSTLSGYAWSENIGWISFNCSDAGICGTSNYAVSLDSVTGNLSGYAWSENIGWISFNAADVSGCPGGTCQPRLSGGALLGWAKALGAADGWDGFISLNCANTGACGTSNYAASVSGSAVSGYAWGSDVVGWLSFNCSNTSTCGTSNYAVSVGATTPPSIMSFTATPSQVNSGSSATLNWTTANASACTGSGGWSGSKGTAGPASTGALLVDTSFTLTCTNAVGSVQSTIPVTIYVPPDFSLSSTNNIKKTSIQVDSSTTTIKVTPINSFTNPVTLSGSPATLGGVPVTYVFSSPALTSLNYSTGSTLNVTSTIPLPNGVYTVIVTGTDGTLVHTVNIQLNISSTTRRIEEI